MMYERSDSEDGERLTWTEWALVAVIATAVVLLGLATAEGFGVIEFGLLP